MGHNTRDIGNNLIKKRLTAYAQPVRTPDADKDRRLVMIIFWMCVSNRRAQTNQQTSKQMDKWMLPYILSPFFSVDKYFTLFILLNFRHLLLPVLKISYFYMLKL